MLTQSFLAAFLAFAQPAAPKAVVAKADTSAKTDAKTATAKLKADEVVTKVQAYYDTVKKFKATFRQEYTNTTFGTTKDSDGIVMIAEGGKMRWDYTKPEKKFFISDGSTLWVYEESAKQAFKASLADEVLPTAISFLYGEGDLAKEFTAELDPGTYGGKDDYVLKLTPKESSSNYKTLWLVVDPTEFRVKESIILEASDNVNHFTFKKVKVNDKAVFKDSSFKFKPPKGVKVVEPDQAPTDPTPQPLEKQ